MGSTDVSILLGNGSGGFSPASGSPVTVGDYPFGVAVGDFNGDGDADLAAANWGSDDVSILPGNGTGGFSAPGSLGFALLLLPFACHKRHRARPQRFLVWMMLPTLTSLGVVSGCGEGGYLSQTEQTHTITVTGTSGNLVRNTTVTLTVE